MFKSLKHWNIFKSAGKRFVTLHACIALHISWLLFICWYNYSRRSLLHTSLEDIYHCFCITALLSRVPKSSDLIVVWIIELTRICFFCCLWLSSINEVLKTVVKWQPPTRECNCQFHSCDSPSYLINWISLTQKQKTEGAEPSNVLETRTDRIIPQKKPVGETDAKTKSKLSKDILAGVSCRLVALMEICLEISCLHQCSDTPHHGIIAGIWWLIMSSWLLSISLRGLVHAELNAAAQVHHRVSSLSYPIFASSCVIFCE
jgi:hypothetical protein